MRFIGLGIASSILLAACVAVSQLRADAPADASQAAISEVQSNPAPTMNWNQWGGDPARNNTPSGFNIPTDWDVGSFDYKTGEWDPTEAKNIKWVAKLGSQSYGNAVVSDGKIYVGTNNSGGWLERYPAKVDLGCLLCFELETGKFLWQHSSEKL